MKKNIFAVIIALIAAFAFMITGCAPQNDSSPKPAYTDYYEGFNLNNQVGSLVKDGSSNYSVVIPENATPAEEQAAFELVRYVAQSTGVQIPTVRDTAFVESSNRHYFSIGRTTFRNSAGLIGDDLDLNGDGFVIKTQGENVIVDARTDRGFLYGTYEFLEKMVGVKFLAPDETYIPSLSEIPVYETDLLSVPAFRLRTYLNYMEHPLGFDEEFSAHSRNLSNWNTFSDRFGGKGPIYGRGEGTHNARLYVPAEKYGTRESTGYTGEFAPDHDPHPEFYIQAPGATIDWNVGAYLTIDWTNGIAEDGTLDESMDVSVAKVVIEEMKKDILANPEAEYILFEQEDTIDPVVDQEQIDKYGASGVLIRFCNVVATELQKWADAELDGREIKIVTFAYNQTQNAPVKKENGKYVPNDSTVIPADNVYIRLAYSVFEYYSYDDERQSEQVREMSASWSSICENFFFWGYDAMYGGDGTASGDFIVYNPSLGGAYDTIQMLRRIGVEYVMMQSSHCAPNDWQAYLKHYVWSKLMWNPDQEVTRLVEEYITGYYGPAADKVREMINLLDAHYGKIVAEIPDIAARSAYWKSEIGNGSNLSIELLDKAVAILEEGEQIVQADETLTSGAKDNIMRRLAAVKVTPLWMKLKFFSELNPLADSREKTELAILLNNTAGQGGVKRLNENEDLTGRLSLSYGI